MSVMIDDRVTSGKTRLVGRDVIHRWEGNPIITLEDIPFSCNTVFNAAAVKCQGHYILLIRVEDKRGRSIFALARSEDGYRFVVNPDPCMVPSTEEPFATYEACGIEDPRITETDGTYYVMYTAYSRYGPRLALAKTDDFQTYERIALISEPVNKDGALFPRKINGRYVRFDRPNVGSTGNIWVSYSDDLINWGGSEVVMSTRTDHWDRSRIGASAPPIETEQGWLEIYHGVKEAAAGPIYRLGVVMLDLENPAHVLGRAAIPILTPREYYERVGDIGNVVFSCGAIYEEQTRQVKMYYGAADTCICVGTAKLDALIERCFEEEDAL
ncbi:MAG: glycoside hydrolase family 130 protein [Phycisphaerales bacterium]|nr:MAG: glycoside hydrolase family 130 protein [Phycisphaerales bacterium]